jgi:hypothetical protein
MQCVTIRSISIITVLFYREARFNGRTLRYKMQIFYLDKVLSKSHCMKLFHNGKDVFVRLFEHIIFLYIYIYI